MKVNGIFTGGAIRATVAALALIGVLTAGVAASAATTAPLKVTYQMTYVEKDGPYNIWSGVGGGTVVGQAPCAVAVKVMGNNGEGVTTITVANGDSLIIAFAQAWDKASSSWVGTFTVTGGNGRFAAASGGGAAITVVNADGTVSFTMDGRISF